MRSNFVFFTYWLSYLPLPTSVLRCVAFPRAFNIFLISPAKNKPSPFYPPRLSSRPLNRKQMPRLEGEEGYFLLTVDVSLSGFFLPLKKGCSCVCVSFAADKETLTYCFNSSAETPPLPFSYFFFTMNVSSSNYGAGNVCFYLPSLL